MSSDTTAVYVHESRFPLRILKHLAKAGPPGVGTQVKRLDALFRYEANVKERPSQDSAAQLAPPSSRQVATSDGASSREKGKAKQTALEESTTVRTRHDDDPYRRSLLDNGDAHTSEILTFESPIEGLVTQWCLPEGQLLINPNQPILRILEPCKHPVQLGGLCAVCGKDLTSVDYTGFRETSRASISMAHDTAHLTVSLEEAARLEQQTTSRLRKEHKLSLIVDLDQTIIHATVDPTVGEWMFDEKNPNYPVLRDVQRFKLLNEEGKEDGCWYYVKPRPSLKHFLEEASKIYELHVYTMGTRQYAENVCRIIDPDGRMFANRILSRDESGSMVRKSLERLFPVDQSMVVIIDDRADIWDWSPHLVKVVPYDFFVGIGDINSAFLPKQKSALASMPKVSEVTQDSAINVNKSKVDATSLAVADESAAISEQIETLDHQLLDKPLARMQEEKSAALHEAMDHAKSDNVAPTATAASIGKTEETAATEDGSIKSPQSAKEMPAPNPPLASTTDVAESDIVSDSSDSDISSDSDTEDATVSAPTANDDQGKETRKIAVASSPLTSGRSSDMEGEGSQIPPEEEAVLHDDDNELERVLDLLHEIHSRFYTSSDAALKGVQFIIPRIKSEVLQGCNIVFSGVIPLDKKPETSEVWQLAEQFGATCSEDLTRRTTHVIAARKGTSKVNSAQRRRDVSIVTLSWLLTSVNLWRRQPESAYILDGGSPQPSEVASSLNDELDAAQKSLAEAPDHMPDEAEDLHDIDWGDAEAEIEAFLNETDEEDSRIEILHEDTADEHTSEDEASYSPTDGKKRSLPDSSASTSSVAVGSPLAKRRRVAAARVGRSKLKLSQKAVGTEGDEEVDDDAEDEELDDFARALEGELM